LLQPPEGIAEHVFAAVTVRLQRHQGRRFLVVLVVRAPAEAQHQRFVVVLAPLGSARPVRQARDDRLGRQRIARRIEQHGLRRGAVDHHQRTAQREGRQPLERSVDRVVAAAAADRDERAGDEAQARAKEVVHG
jgi:hypothetical protein